MFHKSQVSEVSEVSEQITIRRLIKSKPNSHVLNYNILSTESPTAEK